jgi:Domain of unknown function (DUF5071)
MPGLNGYCYDMSTLKTLLPQDKHDLDAVSKLQAEGYPNIAPLLDDIIYWIADGNWPVAPPMADFIVSVGPPAIPALRRVLQGEDVVHQYFCLFLVVSKFSPDLIALLQRDLEQIVDAPTADQVLEEVPILAGEILRTLSDSDLRDQS